MNERRIAIVGAGFAGLALCWYLQQECRCHISVYDGVGIGGGASAISAGLVHPFTGPEARASAAAKEAFQCSRELIQRVVALDPTAILSHGILRVALTENQQMAFKQRSVECPELLWLSASEVQRRIPGVVAAPGIWIEQGLVVDSQRYLQGLWSLCEQQGAVFHRETIADLAQLSDYDQVVVTSGFASRRFPELADYGIRGTKGQMLELAWPEELAPLQIALNSDVYIIPTPGSRSCIVGATFEHNFASEAADVAFAESYLRPRAESLLPALQGARLIHCRAGMRATTPSRQPIARHISGRVWALTALGSKGLLYHAWLARKVAGAVSAPRR